jgi:hypothetical protein
LGPKISVMYHPVKTLQDFTKSLAGLWLNPRTKSKFYFSADKSNPAGGEINVLQQGRAGRFPFILIFPAAVKKYS